MSFVGLLNQTLTLYKAQSTDEYGRISNSDSEAFYCRFEELNESMLTPEGNTLQIVGKIFLDTEAPVENDDKITYESVDYKVVAVDKVFAKGQLHHYEVKVIKWL